MAVSANVGLSPLPRDVEEGLRYHSEVVASGLSLWEPHPYRTVLLLGQEKPSPFGSG